MMIRSVIIDDEPLALEILEHFVSRIPQLQLVSKCSNAIEGFRVLHEQEVDLLLLDIKMPGITGLDFIASLKNPPAVIFTTAFAEYAVKGFELEAIDYLLKPISFERFEKAIQKVLKIQVPVQSTAKDYTYFKISGKLVRIDHSELLYAQSVKDYIQLFTKNGNYLVHMTMKYITDLLPAAAFLRVHRSYLVNKNHIKVAAKNEIEIGEERIPVGENYRHLIPSIG